MTSNCPTRRACATKIAQQGEQPQIDQQQGLDHRRQFNILAGPVGQRRRANQRREHGQHIDAQQNTQHDAKIAPVGQGVSRGKVPILVIL
jgi:hypothetical protein